MLSDHTTPATTPSVNVTPDLAARATGLLSRFYGYSTFRPLQLDIIATAMEGATQWCSCPQAAASRYAIRCPPC